MRRRELERLFRSELQMLHATIAAAAAFAAAITRRRRSRRRQAAAARARERARVVDAARVLGGTARAAALEALARLEQLAAQVARHEQLVREQVREAQLVPRLDRPERLRHTGGRGASRTS